MSGCDLLEALRVVYLVERSLSCKPWNCCKRYLARRNRGNSAGRVPHGNTSSHGGPLELTHPDFNIVVDGNPLMAKDRVVTLKIKDVAGDMGDHLEVVFDDSDHAIAVPSSGVTLAVYLGYKGNLHEYGHYIADDIEITENTLAVQASSFNKSASLKTVRSQSYGRSVPEAIKTVCKRNGLDAFIHADIARYKVDSDINQNAESDLHFLTRVVKDAGGFYKIEGKRLMVLSRSRAETASGQPLEALVLKPNQFLRGWTVRHPLREVFKSCSAFYYDIDRQQEETVLVGHGEPSKKLTKRYWSASEARHAAKVELKGTGRKKSDLTFKTVGNPMLRAHLPIDLNGFRDGVDGRYLITEAEHQISDDGYKTAIKAQWYGEDIGDDDDDTP